MLFNSFEFSFGFLPFILIGFLILGKMRNGLLACSWLALGSVFFYAYWIPEYLLLLLTSITVNYALGGLIHKKIKFDSRLQAKSWLIFAIIINIFALGYFKYANFLVDNLNLFSGSEIKLAHITLPIGISFFTFTQIAYLVDTYQGKVRETNPIHYLLFVTYFPHLIAGPILHHAEMMPQFRDQVTFCFNRVNFLSGLAVFLIGLFKKVILADSIQPYVAPVFDADINQALTTLEAWGGALAYTLQLYFDFSGYSDMAIGLSRMFNIELPLNFNSPYKAKNISEFWRRWHITLSRFLRDYLYVPLGGNRCGKGRKYSNLMVTMLLGGLWHGAGWPFVIWGGLHGFYLACNHAWQAIHNRIANRKILPKKILDTISVLITFICVVIAWVFFRAKDFDHATRVLTAMADFGNLVLPIESVASTLILKIFPTLTSTSLTAFGGDRQIGWTFFLLVAVWGLPNTQQIVTWIRSKTWPRRAYSAEASWFLIGAASFWLILVLIINETRGVSEFIYFNF